MITIKQKTSSMGLFNFKKKEESKKDKSSKSLEEIMYPELLAFAQQEATLALNTQIKDGVFNPFGCVLTTRQEYKRIVHIDDTSTMAEHARIVQQGAQKAYAEDTFFMSTVVFPSAIFPQFNTRNAIVVHLITKLPSSSRFFIFDLNSTNVPVTFENFEEPEMVKM